MKLNKVLLSIGFAALTPCALVAEPAPVFDVSQTVTASASDIALDPASESMSQQLTNIERKLDVRNRAQLKLLRQLGELQNEVDELRGITEHHSHQLGQILERQRELYQELDKRVSQALQPAPASVATAAATSHYSEDLTENEAYDRAVNLVLKDKQYEKAIPAFQAFNTKFPESMYAANAHYWLGQLLFNKGDLVKAREEFSVVVEQYPDSTKRSDAMLKLAIVEQKENNTAIAVSLYTKLIKEYPGSSAALLAKPKLESLTQ